MDFLKLLVVFTKPSLSYLHIPVDEDYIVSNSQLSTIVNIQSGFKFFITIPDNFSSEQYTATLTVM